MSRSQMGVVTYWARHHDIPAPAEVDDAYLAGGTSDIDKLVAFWKTTKGGELEVEGDVDEAIAAAGATPGELGSPWAGKKGKKK
jgi:hypothetical protein